MYFCNLNKILCSAAILFAFGTSVLAQDRMESIRTALESEGFSNIRTADAGDKYLLTIQNDAWKLQASGIAAAIRTLEKEGFLEDKAVEMIVTDYDVPQVTLKYNPNVGSWEVTHRLDRDNWKLVSRQAKTASSFGKVDINVYPQVSLMNLIITQVYQSLWQLNPALEVSLWPGGKVSYQVKIPIYNDGYGKRESKVHPGLFTVSQRFRIPYADIMGKASAGVFSNNRYGLGVDWNRRFNFAPWMWLEGSFAMLGLCYWDGFVLHYDKDLAPYWSMGGGFYVPQLETSFTGRVQKFLLDDYGIKCEMIRHFRNCSIGFYAEKGLNNYAHTNGGFRFSIALPPYRYKRHGYIPRVGSTGNLGMTYNANNEQRWYKETKFEASDNITTSNAFNPYYIKKEIDKLNK